MAQLKGVQEHHCDMSMAFHFGHKETVLFGPWEFNSIGGLIGSMFAIMIMAFAYECLKTFVEHLYSKHFANVSDRPSRFSFYHISQTLLFGLQVILGNLIMLIFMTYNVWLCLAVVIGAMIGYFLFGLKRSPSSANKCGCH